MTHASEIETEKPESDWSLSRLVQPGLMEGTSPTFKAEPDDAQGGLPLRSLPDPYSSIPELYYG